MPEATTSWIQWLILECGLTNVNCRKKKCNFTSQKLPKKVPTWRQRNRHSPPRSLVILSFRLASTKSQIFPVILKNVFPLSLCSTRYIKMEERTNRLIWLSVESYQSKALKLSAGCQLASSCLAVFNGSLKAELLSPVSVYTAAVYRKWPNTLRLGFIDFL